MNPSTDDILRMVEATPAETVFVLPNNKNIIMAAEQAIPLATRKVCVLPTRTIPQGISAMLAFDEDASTEDNLIAMTKAAENTGTGQITYAARNSNYDGKEIKEGEILALKEGKIAFVEQDMIKAMGKLTKAMVTKDSCQITLITGADVDEDTIAQATAAVEARAMDAEVTVIDGGQPVYYFILSVE
jgi:dihydroxyacetone kinase-like predicted kinase